MKNLKGERNAHEIKIIVHVICTILTISTISTISITIAVIAMIAMIAMVAMIAMTAMIAMIAVIAKIHQRGTVVKNGRQIPSYDAYDDAADANDDIPYHCLAHAA